VLSGTDGDLGFLHLLDAPSFHFPRIEPTIRVLLVELRPVLGAVENLEIEKFSC
jgi:hypothetical protein